MWTHDYTRTFSDVQLIKMYNIIYELVPHADLVGWVHLVPTAAYWCSGSGIDWSEAIYV